MFKKTALSRSLVLAFGGTAMMLAGGSVQAQQQAGTQELQRVEITGSSIKRIDAETALPVQILTRQDIQRTGAANVEQLLQTISSVASSGGLTAASASGATTGGISAVSIHGLTSQRTLVLIDGRRVAPYGLGFSNDSVSVDVNSIALAAIERIEILEDGASAIYGSDAIAGVVNFILRKNYKGVDVSGEYGNSTHGGAGIARGSATLGWGDFSADKYNVMVAVSAQHEKSLVGAQRGFASSAINVEHLQDTTSGNTFPANVALANAADKTAFPKFGTRNPSAPTGCAAPFSTIDPLFSSNSCRFDPAPLVTLVPGSKRVSLLVSGRLALTDDIEAYAMASYNENKIRSVVQPVPLSDQFAIPATNPLANSFPYNTYGASIPSAAILLRSSSPYYPTAYVRGLTDGVATPDLLVRYRSNLSGNRDIKDTSKAPRLVLGAKGNSAGWDWDGAFLYTSSTVSETDSNGYPLYSQILPLLNSGNVNFFGDNTPAVASQVEGANFRGEAFKVKTSIKSLAAKASREVLQLPAGALSVAIGAEARRESYNFEASTALQQGDVSGYGGNFLPVDKGRNVYAGFVEAVIPIVKGLEADIASRFDHYEGVGNAFTPKLGLRYQPVNEFLMRGSIGKGFRAPSLADLYANNTQSVSPTGLSDPARCPTTADGIKDCATQFSVTQGGNSNLKPEKSHNGTIGFVLQPTSNLSVSVDYFKVLLRDTITTLDSDTILSDVVKYAPYIQRGAVDPSFPNLPGPISALIQTNTNLGSTKVAGFELAATYRLPTSYGRFTFDWKGTYFMQYDTSNPDGTYTGNIDQPNGSTGGVIPRYKHYLTVNWNYGSWDVALAQNFQKHYHDTAGNLDDEENVRDVASYIVYDGQATWSGIKGWKFTLGVRNLFDRAPPYVNTNAAFQSGYDPQYADPRGRYVYGRVNYSFN